MIKTGIYTISQLKDYLGVKVEDWKEKKISITLYEKIVDEPNADILAERILLSFSDDRGAYKRTYANRFEAFDKESLSIFQKYFKSDEAITVSDVGVSDGRTAVDFFLATSEIFPNVRYKGSDYNPSVQIIENKNIAVTLTHTGNILEVLIPPFVFNTIKRDSYRHYPLNHIIWGFVKHLCVIPMLKKFTAGKIRSRDLFLLCPTAMQLKSQDDRFQLEQHDLMKPFKEKSHITRAMNVLNNSYFKKDEFAKVINNIYNGLNDAGLFITGSNQEAGSTVHGGIYQKTKNGFEEIFKSGDGSPIDALIINFSSE